MDCALLAGTYQYWAKMWKRFGKMVIRVVGGKREALVPLMDLATIFSSLNAAVLIALAYLYSRIVLRTRAPYPAGLVIFASLLLMQNVLTAYSYLAMTSFFGSTVLPYLATISVLEFGGLLVLTRISL